MKITEEITFNVPTDLTTSLTVSVVYDATNVYLVDGILFEWIVDNWNSDKPAARTLGNDVFEYIKESYPKISDFYVVVELNRANQIQKVMIQNENL